MRPQEILPGRARRRNFLLKLLLVAFADRSEVERGLNVLFERRHLFAADDDAGDGLAEIELQKFGGRGAAGAGTDEHALAHDFHRQDAHVLL